MTIRVLIADDHLVVRAGVRTLLQEAPGIEVAGEAADGDEALVLADRLAPDVVLMDLRMPGTDGVTAIDRLRSSHPGIRVLVLTTYGTDADILKAIEAGATGYLLKDAAGTELIQAIHAAVRGEAALAPRVASRLMERTRDPGSASLSSREIEILELVAQGQANREIARTLHISQATVKTHLVHIFAKFGVDDRTRAVTCAIERGILRLDEP